MRDLLGRNEISSLVEMRSGCSLFRFYFTHSLPLFQLFVGVKRAASTVGWSVFSELTRIPPATRDHQFGI